MLVKQKQRPLNEENWNAIQYFGKTRDYLTIANAKPPGALRYQLPTGMKSLALPVYLFCSFPSMSMSSPNKMPKRTNSALTYLNVLWIYADKSDRATCVVENKVFPAGTVFKLMFPLIVTLMSCIFSHIIIASSAFNFLLFTARLVMLLKSRCIQDKEKTCFSLFL